jgi:hypothetical protein
VPVKEMLSRRQMEQKIRHSVHGSGPWPGADDPAGQPSMIWQDWFLPIAEAADTGLLYADLRDGEQYGCVWEWYPEGGMQPAPLWSGVGEMLDDVAGAMVDGRAARQGHPSGAAWRGSPYLPEVEDGYLSWSPAPD